MSFCLAVCQSICISVCLMSFCLAVCHSICMSVCLYVILSGCLSIYLYVCLPLCHSVWLIVNLFVCLSASMSLRLAVCQYVCPPLCHFVWLFVNLPVLLCEHFDQRPEQQLPPCRRFTKGRWAGGGKQVAPPTVEGIARAKSLSSLISPSEYKVTTASTAGGEDSQGQETLIPHITIRVQGNHHSLYTRWRG